MLQQPVEQRSPPLTGLKQTGEILCHKSLWEGSQTRETYSSYDGPVGSTLLPGSSPLFLPGGEGGVLLLHPLASSPAELRSLALQLHGSGLTALCPRLPGHGTNPNDLAATRWEDWLAGAAEGLDALWEACSRVVAVGAGTGALLALLLAAVRPADVDGVVGLDPPAPLRAPARALLLLASTVRKSAPLTWPYPPRLPAPARAVGELLRLERALHRNLPRISAPVLVMRAGAHSGLGSLTRRLPSPWVEALPESEEAIAWRVRRFLSSLGNPAEEREGPPEDPGQPPSPEGGMR